MRVLLGVLTAAAVLVVAGVSYLDRTGTDVIVVNGGRSTIQIRGMLPSGVSSVLAAIGVRNLPDELRPGLPAVVHVPGLSGEVNAAAGAISVTVVGQTMTFAAICDSLELDGATLLGKRTTVHLGERPQHDLKLACR